MHAAKTHVLLCAHVKASTGLTLRCKATSYPSWLPAHGPLKACHVRGAMSLASTTLHTHKHKHSPISATGCCDLSNACCVCNKDLLYCVGWGCSLKCSCCCSWRMLHLLPCRGQGSCWQSPSLKPAAKWLQYQISRFVRCN